MGNTGTLGGLLIFFFPVTNQGKEAVKIKKQTNNEPKKNLTPPPKKKNLKKKKCC